MRRTPAPNTPLPEVSHLALLLTLLPRQVAHIFLALSPFGSLLGETIETVFALFDMVAPLPKVAE